MPSAWKTTEQIVIPCTQEQKSFGFLNGTWKIENDAISSRTCSLNINRALNIK